MLYVTLLTYSERRLCSAELVNQDKSPVDHVMIRLPKLGRKTITDEVIYTANRLVQVSVVSRRSSEGKEEKVLSILQVILSL